MIDQLKNNFRFICCVSALPLMFTGFVVLGPYADYPFVRSVLGPWLLLGLLPLFLMRGRGWERLFKTLGYILLLLAAMVIIPNHTSLKSRFVGMGIADRWYQVKHKGKDVHQMWHFDPEQSRYEIISDNTALFTYPDPPVTLLVTIAQANPHCSGYPEAAEQRCTERLRDLIRTKAEQVPGN